MPLGAGNGLIEHMILAVEGVLGSTIIGQVFGSVSRHTDRVLYTVFKGFPASPELGE